MKRGHVRWIGWVSLLSTLLLSGCWQVPSVDHEAFVDTLAIDYDKGVVQVWVTVINPSGGSKEQLSTVSLGSSDNPLWVGHSKGSSFIEALNTLFPTSPKRLIWSQLSTLILHDSLLKEHYLDVVRTMSRYYEIRYTLLVYGTREHLSDLLSPHLAVETNPLYQFMRTSQKAKQNGFVVAPLHLYKFLRELQERVGTVILPELRLNREAGVGWSGKKRPADQYEVTTAGLLQHGRFVTWLPATVMPGLFWTRLGGDRLPLYLREPRGKRVSATLYVRDIRHRVRTAAASPRLRFDLQIEGTVDLAETTGKTDEPALIRQAEQTVARDVRRSYLYGLAHHADVLNLAVGVHRTRNLPWSPLAHRQISLALTPSSLRAVRVHLNLVHSAMRIPD